MSSLLEANCSTDRGSGAARRRLWCMVAGYERNDAGTLGAVLLPLTTLPKEVAGNELFIAEHGEHNMLFEAITWLNFIADFVITKTKHKRKPLIVYNIAQMMEKLC